MYPVYAWHSCDCQRDQKQWETALLYLHWLSISLLLLKWYFSNNQFLSNKLFMNIHFCNIYLNSRASNSTLTAWRRLVTPSSFFKSFVFVRERSENLMYDLQMWLHLSSAKCLSCIFFFTHSNLKCAILST